MVEVSHFTPAPSRISTVRLVAYRFNSSGNFATFARDPPRDYARKVRMEAFDQWRL
jgi:hypothetical protein